MAMMRDVLWSPFIARGLFADFGRSGRHQYIVSATFTHLLHTEAWTYISSGRASGGSPDG